MLLLLARRAETEPGALAVAFPGEQARYSWSQLWAEILEEEHQRALEHGVNAGDAVNYAWDVLRGAAPERARVFWRIECDVSGTEHDSNPHNAMMSRDNLLRFLPSSRAVLAECEV